jgi:hypothetical protein
MRGDSGGGGQGVSTAGGESLTHRGLLLHTACAILLGERSVDPG